MDVTLNGLKVPVSPFGKAQRFAQAETHNTNLKTSPSPFVLQSEDAGQGSQLYTRWDKKSPRLTASLRALLL